MPDKDMTVMVKTLIDQNKAMVETMKTQSNKREIPGPSNFEGSGKKIKITWNTATKFKK